MARLIVAATLFCIGWSAPLHSERIPTIAAASDLTFALESLADQFAATSGTRVRLVFGSSGHLTRQLLDGAPFELFLSADESFVYKLADAGLTRDRGTVYAIGRIVVFAPHGSPLAVDAELEGLRRLIANRPLTRFAIANPDHAPYGRAAEAALRAANLWDAVRPVLVLGENVAQAAQFASSGDAAGGIVAHSLVMAPPLSTRGNFALLSESMHPPLRQRMVLLKTAGATTIRFYEYLQEPEARRAFERYGFAAPRE